MDRQRSASLNIQFSKFDFRDVRFGYQQAEVFIVSKSGIQKTVSLWKHGQWSKR